MVCTMLVGVIKMREKTSWNLLNLDYCHRPKNITHSLKKLYLVEKTQVLSFTTEIYF